jgi:hypothetical protein
MGLLAYGYWDLVAGEESSTEWRNSRKSFGS